jgi:hypothetical protein
MITIGYKIIKAMMVTKAPSNTLESVNSIPHMGMELHAVDARPVPDRGRQKPWRATASTQGVYFTAKQ